MPRRARTSGKSCAVPSQSSSRELPRISLKPCRRCASLSAQSWLSTSPSRSLSGSGGGGGGGGAAAEGGRREGHAVAEVAERRGLVRTLAADLHQVGAGRDVDLHLRGVGIATVVVACDPPGGTHAIDADHRVEARDLDVRAPSAGRVVAEPHRLAERRAAAARQLAGLGRGAGVRARKPRARRDRLREGARVVGDHPEQRGAASRPAERARARVEVVVAAPDLEQVLLAGLRGAEVDLRVRVRARDAVVVAEEPVVEGRRSGSLIDRDLRVEVRARGREAHRPAGAAERVPERAFGLGLGIGRGAADAVALVGERLAALGLGRGVALGEQDVVRNWLRRAPVVSPRRHGASSTMTAARPAARLIATCMGRSEQVSEGPATRASKVLYGPPGITA